MTPFDKSGRFEPVVNTGEIPKLAVKGAGVTVLSGAVGLAVQIVSTVVLARLLSPRDFGVVAVVTTFSLLLMNFGLNGFTEAIIQTEEITHTLASNLFWINLGITVLLTLGFAASGSLLEMVFHDPLVPAVTAAMALTITLSGLSVQHLALLKRAMRFTTVAANEIVSRVVTVTLSIILARHGWQYWALVGGVVGGAFTQTVGAWYLCRWVPSLPRRDKRTGRMVAFALRVYGRFSVNYFSRNVDNMLVGWQFGATALGYYKKAYDLFALSAGQLSAPLTNVAVAGLSRFNPRSEEYKRNLMAGVSAMALIGMGLAGVLTLAGSDLIMLLLGRGWEPTARIFTYFGPGVGAIILYYVHGWIHLSIGRADRWLRWGIIESVFTSLCFLIALPWGPAGIAIAWTASLWILNVPAFWYALRPIGIGVEVVIKVVWRYIVAGLIAEGASWWIIQKLESAGRFPDNQQLLLRVAWTLCLYSVLYFAATASLLRKWLPLFEVRDSSPLPEQRPARSAESGAANGSQRLPLVSILMPAYNAEDWIADSLRSALAQTWEPKEIIVIDDGSTDRTLEIAKQFECDHLRIYSQPNQGAAAARNKAFAMSRGEYIQWLDADDLLAPDKVELQMKAAIASPTGRTVFTCAFGTFTSRYYKASFNPTGLWRDLSPVDWLTEKMNFNVYMQTDTWLVSRELTEAAGQWDIRLLGDDDGEYFCRLLKLADSIRFVGEAKGYYRLPSSKSLSYIGLSGRKREAQWISMELHINCLRSMDDSPRTRAACVKYLQTGTMFFYPERLDIYETAQQLARELGGQIVPPTLHWRYAWIAKTLGWRAAKFVLILLPTVRRSFERFLDRMLGHFDRRNPWSHAPRSIRATSSTGTSHGPDTMSPGSLASPNVQHVRPNDNWV